MESLFESIVMPCANELGLRRCSEAHKPAGVTLTCDPELGTGFLWTHCSADEAFAVSVMDVRLGELVSGRYDHPEFYALNLMNANPAFLAWEEGLHAYASGDAAARGLPKSPPSGNIVGYHQPEGTFRSPLPKGTRVRSMELKFSPRFLQKVASRFGIEREIVETACFDLSSASAPSAAELAMRQLFSARPSQLSADMYYEGKVLEIVSILVAERCGRTGAEDASDFDADAAGIDRAVSFIHEHAHESLTLEVLERVATMGHTKLTRLFSNRTGMTPIQYLGSVRMQQASCLLRGTSKPIGEIARAVGYDSPGTFAERFKRETGMSPSRFRQASSAEECARVPLAARR